MSQPAEGLEVATPTGPEVEQAIPEVIFHGWKASDLNGSSSSSDDGHISLNKPTTILGLKRGVFYTLFALLALAVIGGLAGGLGGELLSLKRSSSTSSSKSTSLPTPTVVPDSTTGQASRGTFIATSSSAMPSTVDPRIGNSTLTSLSSLASASGPQITTASTLTSAASPSNKEGPATAYASIGTASNNNQPHPGCFASTISNGSVIIPQADSATIAFNGKPQRFQVLCNTNWPAGAMYGNPQVADFKTIDTGDMNECIVQCALWNTSGLSPLCVAAELDATATHCVLKNNTGLNVTLASNLGDGAVLLL